MQRQLLYAGTAGSACASSSASIVGTGNARVSLGSVLTAFVEEAGMITDN